MKKTIIIAVAVATLIVFFLVAPAIQGARIESRIREATRSINQALGQPEIVKIKTYQRGWFRSRLEVVVSIGVGAGIRSPAALAVIHGPLPVVEIIKGEMSPRFFEAQIDSHFTPIIPSQVVQKALASSERKLVNLRAILGRNGAVRVSVTSPKISAPDKRFEWNGASLELAASKKPDDVDIQLRLGGFTLKDSKKNTTLKLREFEWRFRAVQSFASISSDLGCKNFYHRSGGLLYELKELRSSINAERGRHNLLYGSASAALGNLIAQRSDWGIDWKINKILFHSASNLIDDQYASVTQARAQELVTPNTIYGPLGFVLALRQVDPEALYRVISEFDLRPARTEKSDEEQGSGLRKKILDNLLPVFSKGSPRVEAVANIQNGSVRGKISLQTIINSEKVATLKSFDKIAFALIGNLNLRFSAALFNLLWKNGLETFVKASHKENLVTAAKLEAEARTQVQGLLNSKLLVEKEDNYVSKVNLNNGDITVNRLPFDIFRILSDLMVKEPPEITVGFGKLGVRGGLRLDDLRGPIASNLDDIKSCVQKEIDRSQRHPRGVLHIKWKIQKDGQVASPRIIYSTVINQTFEACVLSQISSLKFPPAPRSTKAILVVGFAVGDISQPVTGLRLGTYHHYKNPFPMGTTYTVGPVSVENKTHKR
ncbi:MAG: DUF945 family protein [Deltaproteobacteria bacterium]|nr:DUF945 family protein [Deltaproteobacteria bacterium]